MNQIPGTTYVGQISNPRVNGGEEVPLFNPVNRPGGVNTLEGWNAMAERINRRSFVQTRGREPKDKEELDLWVKELCK